MKRLPVGIHDFKKLIENDYLYIDKTRYLHKIASESTPFFLSRPRRFGKSLTISKLYYLFKGEKQLFKDTYLYDHWEWKKYPIIKISMSELETESIQTIKLGILLKLKEIAEEYGVHIEQTLVKYAFAELIYKLAKTEKVVVLIDEYEKPILDHLQEPKKADEIRKVLRSFYGTLKDSDSYLRFTLITGITKFTKTGVFSTLNNLVELSMNSEYGSMFGYTQQELEQYFEDYLEIGTSRLKVSREELLKKIRDYYNGFSFDGEHFVYNPFSILNFFLEYEFNNYWIESGASSFLVEYARKHSLKPEEYLNTYMRKSMLTTYEIEQAPPINFLVQSGYLTFKGKDQELGYLIDYPNKEVRDAFSELILLGSYEIPENKNDLLRGNIIKGFREKDFDAVFQEMKRLFSAIPYVLFEKKKEGEKEEFWNARNENFFHTVILTLLWSCALDVKAEEMTNRGRSDIVIEYSEDIYILELKTGSAERALTQIKKKGYPEKYRDRQVTLIGIEIDAERRTLGKYIQG